MFTIDVEPDWGVRGCAAVQETLPRLCGLLRARGVRATFFVVACLLDTCGQLLRDLLSSHEIASHGLTHRPLEGMSEREVLRELTASRERLSALAAGPVRGFRAPYLRTPRGWLDLLARAGYLYDSSAGAVYPSPRNRPPRRWRIRFRGGVAQIPIGALATGWVPLSLTWLRLLSPVGERLVSDGSTMVYLHLHELASPRLARVLPMPLRAVLQRGVGEEAWRILERMLDRFGARAVTCSEFISRAEAEGWTETND